MNIPTGFSRWSEGEWEDDDLRLSFRMCKLASSIGSLGNFSVSCLSGALGQLSLYA